MKTHLLLLAGLWCTTLPATAQFVDVGPVSGLANETSHSPALADLDGDGDLDLFLTTEPGNIFTPGFPRTNLLYRNDLSNGALSFQDITLASGLTDRDAWSQDGRFGDLNGDGLLDLYVTNIVIAGQTSPNQLYLGQPGGTFVEVAAVSGALGGGGDDVGQLVDFDRDGRLDIYTGQNGRNYLYRNVGVDPVTLQPTFQQFGSLLLQDLLRDTWSAPFCDVDLDGDRDVYLANRADVFGSDGRDILFLNQGGTGMVMGFMAGFNDVPLNGFAAFGDFDNDGDPDLYVSNWRTFSSTVRAAPHGQLYRNDGTTFTNVTTSVGLGVRTGEELSLTWFDHDNDGDLDLFVVTAEIGNANLFYENQLVETGTATFVEKAQTLGLADPRFVFGCAVGDLDRDGFQDVVTTCEGDIFGQYYPGVFLNAGNANHWLTRRPKGTVSTTCAAGLRATCVTPDGNTQWRELGAMAGTYGQNAPEIHFGAGTNASVDHVTLHWPSGIVQRLENPTIDTVEDVVETGVALRGQPVLQGTLSIEVGGPAGDTVILAAAAATASIPLPPFGTLGLDPLTLAILDVFALPANGRRSIPAAIPNDPALVGGTIHVQPAIGPGASVTLRNVASLTIQ